MSLPVSATALESFQERLGYAFGDPDLLHRALTHRSWCAEHAEFSSNERLEFLGDAVLGVLVTDDIYRRYPDAGEGQLSRVRASVVCAAALADMARELGLGDVLLLGKGEAASGGRDRPSILADAMEAVIGAVYLDGGPRAAHALVAVAQPAEAQCELEGLGLIIARALPPDHPLVLNYTRVAAAYVRALGNGPAEFGFDRIAELFTAVPAGRLTNTLTTGPFYSRFHLAVVEEVVFALVSDEFALGPTGRKWLDDDEFLVRSRVHADVRAERGRAGV